MGKAEGFRPEIAEARMTFELERELKLTSIDPKIIAMCEKQGITTVGQLRDSYFILARGGGKKHFMQNVGQYFQAVGITSIPMPAEEFNSLSSKAHEAISKQ